jgi:branched-chain amino acid transport system permease protein
MNWALIFSNATYVALSSSAAAYALIAIGLNVHIGYTGLLNFGQAGFAAAGAYGMAIPIATFGWHWSAAIGSAVFFAILLALLLGVPTLRLKSDYLAIVTIAAAEIIRISMISVRFTWLTGGTDGKKGFSAFLVNANPFGDNRYSFFAQSVNGYSLFITIIGWTLVAIFGVLVYFMMRGPWGRALRGIREDEIAVQSLGKSTTVFKLQSLVLGGVIGAFGGIILAAEKQSAQPMEYGTTLTFFAFTIVILGGLATARGPIIGAILFWFILQFVDNVLEQVARNDIAPSWLINSNNFGQVKFILAGFALALLVIFRPQGIYGNKREMAFDSR